ncbi:integral membrane protein [Leptodontidium sp. MPI-SDFR-AT-0119]|nr:integral membrane protein [Leptodontidium sp. MPI-SDFR-AT-0119]
MKLLRALLLILLSAVVHAQVNASSELSPCALSCVAQSVPAAGCALDDVACQCKSKPLSLLIAGCMVNNCTMQESLDLSRSQVVTCGLPVQNKSNLMIGLFTFIIIFTSILVALRLASKVIVKKQLSPEDYIAGLAQGMSIVSNTFAIEMARHGFGKHLYSLRNGAMKAIFLRFYIGENIYVAVLGLVKISILTFYLRIFQLQIPFRIAVYTTIVFIVLGSASISFSTIFQCRPIAYFWDKDLHGKCLDVNALAYANSGLSIVQDFLIIGLPIRVVWNMNLDRKKKWSVAFMFALGGFGCIISIVRLQSLLIFGTSIDPTWDYVAVTIWTVLELAVAIVCSCLPALRQLIIHIYPKLVSSFRSSETTGSSSVNSRTILRANSRTESTTGMYLMNDVHIECGKLDIKWEGDVQHIEDLGGSSRRRDSWM